LAGPDFTEASNKPRMDVVGVNKPRKGGEAMAQTGLNTYGAVSSSSMCDGLEC
jgi:hypothetical protein